MSHRTLLLAAITGILTGAAVAAFEWVTNTQLYERLLDQPHWVQVLAPVVGLAIAAVALVTIGRGASPSTSDEYIHNFHEPGRLDLKPVWGRIVAGIATLGSGGALGYEGPSLYMGASIGTAIQKRWSRYFTRDETKVLMVAGAAAGVAAIFKAPATGAVFALEVPYRDDTAKGVLLPALLAAAAGYLTFVLLLGTDPLFSVAGTPPFDVRDLGGAALLGLLCGGGARAFAWVVLRAKGLAARWPITVRVPLAGALLALLAVISIRLFDEPLALGSGYAALHWVSEPDHSLQLIVALFVIRLLATAVTVGGGGVGGLFVPLVVAGAITGGAVSNLVHDPANIFPLVGVAAFLGAGYRTPLAGVMFVAETTGRPGYIVPGLIASVAAQLVMGDVSASPYQGATRLGHLERRFRLPIEAAIDADVMTVPSDATLAELYQEHLLRNRRPEVPVVDGAAYRGIVSLSDIQRVPLADWTRHTVGEVLDGDRPTIGPSATLGDAVRAMEAADVDAVAVLDDGGFVGMVTSAGIFDLEQILDQFDEGR